jgi:pseudouridine-5'-phosphate glycosidase
MVKLRVTFSCFVIDLVCTHYNRLETVSVPAVCQSNNSNPYFFCRLAVCLLKKDRVRRLIRMKPLPFFER